MAQGYDLTVAQKLAKYYHKHNQPGTAALVHIIVAGGLPVHQGPGQETVCPDCGHPSPTRMHRCWRCGILQDLAETSTGIQYTQKYRQQAETEYEQWGCFWTMGVVLLLWVTPPPRIQYHWSSGPVDPEDTTPTEPVGVTGTDGSGGPFNKDPRMRTVGAAAVPLNQESTKVLRARWGPIAGPQTVPRAEAVGVQWGVGFPETSEIIVADASYTLNTVHKKLTEKTEHRDVWHKIQDLLGNTRLER